MLPDTSDIVRLLSSTAPHQRTVLFVKKQTIFSHGDRSDSIFYIRKGSVKLTVTSSSGKEALVGFLDGGHFIGESCLAGHTPTRIHTATALTDVEAVKIGRDTIIRTLRVNAELAYAFIAYLLKRNTQIEEDLVNNLLASSEQRLAQLLLAVKRFTKADEWGPVPRLSQQELASAIGVTRQRVNVLLKRLRKSASASSPAVRLGRNGQNHQPVA